MRQLSIALAMSVALLCSAEVVGAENSDNADQKIEFFETKIRPVLAEHCIECHGRENQESGLRLDHSTFIRKKATYGIAVVPGQPGESLLIKAISHTDPDLKMPDGEEKLAPAVIADFEKWIRDGAVWPDEPVPTGAAAKDTFDLQARKDRLPWIWQRPRRQPLPTVRNGNWPIDEIDHFILHSLEKNELSPAPPAEPMVWLRRAFFATTGLPPTPGDIRDFENAAETDLTAAKRHVLSQLLDSPHFGERWARHWMDLMRYAESRGHESDFVIGNAWRYRDYLIRAFNDDVRYDQFVLEHLAGDLLQQPRVDSKSGANLSVLATGWAFLGEEVHSPVDIRQDELERIDNKVDVLSKSFLGITVACARCHDHKFDAIKQSDYYALSGFIQSSNYRQVRFESMEHNRRIGEEVKLLDAATRSRLATVVKEALSSTIRTFGDDLLAAITSPSSEDDSAVSHWQKELSKAEKEPQHPLHALARVRSRGDKSLAEVLYQVLQEHNEAQHQWENRFAGFQVLADFSDENEMWMQDGETFGHGAELPAQLRIGSPETPIAGVVTAAAARKRPFWDGLQLAKDNESDQGEHKPQSRAGRMIRTREVAMKTGRIFYLTEGKAGVYAGVDSHIMLAGPLHTKLTRSIEGELAWREHDVSRSDGERVYIQFGANPGEDFRVIAVVEAATGDSKPPLQIERPNALLHAALKKHGRADLATLVKSFQQVLSESLAGLEPNVQAGHRGFAAHAQLLEWMLKSPQLFVIPEDATAKMTALVNEDQRLRSGLREKVREHSATAVAWMDGNGVDERVLIRGRYTKPSGVAPRALPSAFPNRRAITGRGSGRLELARQIVDPANPLAARVIVNRVWHHLFGRGIVASVDNFGWLGERPSHPALLDHLAWHFVHTDEWSLKRLIRRILLSQTFAMSSRAADPAHDVADPANVLLHRMPVKRLEAEAIRDAILTVSGRLDRTLYGKPIPVHLTEFVVGRGRPGQSGPRDGAGRRTIYTALRRNFLSPLMLAFDLPTPFSTVGRRPVTNVPAQSLALMNNPMIFEQSRVWAQRILNEMADKTPEQRVQRMYIEAFARPADPQDIADCLDSLAAIADETGQPVHSGEVWAELCHALFSVNEFIYLR